ncbi:MAG: hypothetical protein HLUCCO18_02965 [Rhodobacteraceae bacterium HLUCCO18]|nr:MAG: hypothetical protein HLUCCO18_02965 [Rhodobacteraceae bacterium HLUCCO18]
MAQRTQNAERQTGPATRRAEKLSALSALLGPEAMDRLRRRDAGFREPAVALSSTSEERVAWQRNRLIERLRGQWSAEAGTVEARGGAATAVGTRRAGPEAPVSVDTRIAAAVDLATLADEHPAVIVRVLEKMDREERIAVLRCLPGPTARAVIHRLRSR